MAESLPEKPLSTGEWIVTELILIIPVVGIIMYFVWAFTDGNIGRRNLCRARLIICACALALGVVVLIGLALFTTLLAGMAGKHGYH